MADPTARQPLAAAPACAPRHAGRRATCGHSQRRRCSASVLLAALLAAAPAAAQLELRPLWDAAEWLPADTPIALEVVAPPPGRLVLFLGPTDVTDLFRRTGNRLVYRPELLPLPPGESELVVWAAAPEGWRELGRFPVRVLTRRGLEASELALRLDLDAVTDLASGGSDEPVGEERLGGQLDLRQTASRRGWRLAATANVLGVSEVERALRFADEGEEADLVDLSSWGLEVARGRFELGVGHLSWGSSRLLVEGFSSRGARLRVPLGRVADASLAALHGTAIVGWDHLLGLSRSEHRIAAGTLGLELRPARPGALRLELTGLDGSLLPRNGFNTAELTDREESEGWSVRVLAAPTDRFRLDASWAESAFDNPLDPLLAQGDALVPVTRERRGAGYLDLAWTLVRRQTASGRHVDLALDGSYRRVEPLYRSVAAFVQPDVEEGSGQLRLLWGGVSALVSRARGRDNLDELASVLTTRTDRRVWSVLVPLVELAGTGGTSDAAAGPSPWWPVLSLSGERTHQAGDGVPVDGGFSASHVPDQVSLSHQASLQWTGGRWNLVASGSLSEQDNRQPGREEADFEHGGFGFALFSSPLARLDLGVDLRRERAESLELGEVTTTDVAGLSWTVRLPARHVLTGSLAWTASETEPGIRSSDDLVGNAQWSWSFERRRRAHGLGGRLYLGGSYREARAEDLLFGFHDRRDGWRVTAGTTLSLY